MSTSPASLLYKDFTIKARLTNPDETEKLLRSFDAVFVGTDLQTDHYFETPKGKLKWRKGTIENLITHYERFEDHGIERTTVYRYDINPARHMIDELKNNHKSIGITTKERKIYKLDNIKIHLDKLPSREEFIEIEAIDLESRYTIDELRSQCLDIKGKLRINDLDLIPTGYFKSV